MTGEATSTPDPRGRAPERPDDDDHDVLTCGEAVARLHEEFEWQQEHLARLRADGAPGVEEAQRRLKLLLDTAERNARQPINDENFEQFFGYRGTARRNT
jgi:hypothetical protein